MPGLDGLQLLARIRERWPELPVLIISGHGDKVMEEQAFALGAVGFETKPLQLGDLVERLRRLFEADTQG
jgi:FixJ family two-component response regulator